MAAYLKINDVDISGIVSGLKVGKETLVSDNSGRNAKGDTVIDIINTKYKVYVTLRHTTAGEMQSFLNLIKDYVVTVNFLNPLTRQLETITAYTGTPEPEYYSIEGTKTPLFKPLSINFIQL